MIIVAFGWAIDFRIDKRSVLWCASKNFELESFSGYYDRDYKPRFFLGFRNFSFCVDSYRVFISLDSSEVYMDSELYADYPKDPPETVFTVPVHQWYFYSPDYSHARWLEYAWYTRNCYWLIDGNPCHLYQHYRGLWYLCNQNNELI